jgi:hypothetical protein
MRDKEVRFLRGLDRLGLTKEIPVKKVDGQ